MKVSVVALFGVVLSTASPLPCFAGPCSAEIDAIESQIDAGLEAVAAAGRGGAETVAATKHHQPTPKSIAEAEAHAAKLIAEKKTTHFVQPVKVPIEEKKEEKIRVD